MSKQRRILSAPSGCSAPAARRRRRPLPGRAFTLVELPAVSRREGGAFTLVELLVVVAIIALLVTILMPSLTRAKEMTLAVVCLSNVRGINTALALYSAQWNGRMPITRGWGADQGGTYLGWATYLIQSSYITDPGNDEEGILFCLDKLRKTAGETHAYWPNARSHYGHTPLGGDACTINWGIVPSPWDNPEERFLRYRDDEWGPYLVDEVTRPDRLIRVAEGAWFWQIPYARYVFTDYLGTNGKGSPGVFYVTPADYPTVPQWTLHLQSSSLGFFDGHAERFPHEHPTGWASAVPEEWLTLD